MKLLPITVATRGIDLCRWTWIGETFVFTIRDVPCLSMLTSENLVTIAICTYYPGTDIENLIQREPLQTTPIHILLSHWISSVMYLPASRLMPRADPSPEELKKGMELPLVAAIIFLVIFILVVLLSFCGGGSSLHSSTHPKNPMQTEERHVGKEDRKTHDTVWEFDGEWSDDYYYAHNPLRDKASGRIISADKVRPGMPLGKSDDVDRN